MSTPPSGGEGHNPYGQQPNPPYPYGQQPGGGSTGSSPYGGSQPAQPPYGSQPAPPSYPTPSPSPPPSYGEPAPRPYGESAPPTQQFSAPTYGQPSTPSYGQPGQQPAYGQPSPPAYGQPSPPAYGQPGYGQQYGQPDWSGSPGGQQKKSRTPLIAGIVAAVVLLIVVLALALPGSPIGLGKTYFDEQQVAEDISEQYEDEFGLPIEVECPADQEVVTGDTFSCEGQTEEGDTVELDVEITSDDGDYTWSEA